MSFNFIQIILIFIIAFLAGCEGVLDEWQFLSLIHISEPTRR